MAKMVPGIRSVPGCSRHVSLVYLKKNPGSPEGHAGYDDEPICGSRLDSLLVLYAYV